MEILNTIYEQPIIADYLAGAGIICLVFGFFVSFIAAIENHKKISIFFFVLGVAGAVMVHKAANIERSVVKYEVILTDMTYNELIEDYEVLYTKDRILVVQEKEK